MSKIIKRIVRDVIGPDNKTCWSCTNNRCGNKVHSNTCECCRGHKSA